MKPHARFLLWFAVFAALLGVVPLLNLVVILRSGELAPLRDIVKTLHDTGAIYGTALHDVRGELPVEIVRHRQPEVIALGSSRPLELRQEFFTRPFACACGGMDSIEDGETYGELLLGLSRPKLVLLALDFWWFTTREPHRRSPMNLEATVQMTRAKLLRPTGWLREGTLSTADYLHLVAGERDLSGVGPRPKIGVMAIKRGFGIRADGSLMSGIRMLPQGREVYETARWQVQHAREFVLTEPRRRGAHTRFGPDNVLVPERLEALDRVVAKFRAAGAQVILFLPPVAPPVAKAMAESGRHRFLADLDRALRSRDVEYYNFHDPVPLGSSLCEFGDAYHPGNVTFMRMLRNMVQTSPKSPLAQFVDRARLDDGIARFAGRTMATFEADGALPPETDYLDAGCKRSA